MELSVKERLIGYLSYKGVGRNKFESMAGISNGYITNLKDSPRALQLKKILHAAPDLNEVWLLTGKGDMLINTEPIKSSYDGKPFYDVPFEMGYGLPFEQNTKNADFYVNFEPYNKCDLWCRATGLSMQPTICNGDAVALKKIDDFRYLVNNEIYAIVMKSGLRTIKRTWDNGDSYTLIADNKDCPNQTIPKEEILAVFKVIGSTKMF